MRKERVMTRETSLPLALLPLGGQNTLVTFSMGSSATAIESHMVILDASSLQFLQV
jgi:hypothetical protein